MNWLLRALALLFVLAQANAETERITPVTDADRYRSLIAELRCVKCQNQSLADSDAPVAHDLRRIVREQMATGASDEEIKQYLVQRYGEFVLYRPRLSPQTWLLWFGPLLFVVAGGLFGFRMIRRQSNVTNDQ